MADFDPTLVAEIVRSDNRAEPQHWCSSRDDRGHQRLICHCGSSLCRCGKGTKIWHAMPRADKAKVIAALRQTMHDHAEEFARRSQQETGMGRVEDKIAKHHNAADATPGLEDLEVRSWSGDKGLVVEEYALMASSRRSPRRPIRFRCS